MGVVEGTRGDAHGAERFGEGGYGGEGGEGAGGEGGGEGVGATGFEGEDLGLRDGGVGSLSVGGGRR